MRSEIAIRDDELSREREDLSYDAVDDIMNDVWPFPCFIPILLPASSLPRHRAIAIH